MVVAEDGCRLWAEVTGDGPPLILCHGGPGLWDMFGDVAAMLAPRMRVIRWDQRGCGRSSRRGPYTVERMVRDVEAVRRHFGLDRTAVLGHSWGASLALQYALAFPGRVSKLVYVSGTGLERDWHPHYKRNLTARVGGDTGLEDRDAVLLQWSADFADRDKAMAYAERMGTPWFEINYSCNAELSSADRISPQECRGLTVPTLIVDGAQDIRPRWAVDSLERALPCTTRVVLPDAGHVPWLEQPSQFRTALLRFLVGAQDLVGESLAESPHLGEPAVVDPEDLDQHRVGGRDAHD